MQDVRSTPDGVCTADLCLERDSVDLENLTKNTLLQSIMNCENPAMLLGALCSIDVAMEALERCKTQAENKVHGLAFAADLFVGVA